jgi:DNA mismatch repair protein MutL
VKQDPVSCAVGCNFSVKNLFFNIPARRKFLKADYSEFGHILTEFKKTALARPDIKFSLYHNDAVIYKLKKSGIIQRISELFGKPVEKLLIPVNGESEIMNITGYVGKPESAKKRNEEQYFFVNQRFMKHAYFYKAVLSAYEQIISSDKHPTFFLYFDIEPHHIDINIHPAKIQINFDETQGIYQIVRATVKNALGTFNVVPSIDFDRDGYIDMPYSRSTDIQIIEPQITDKTTYNPFEDTSTKSIRGHISGNFKNEKIKGDWEQLYTDFNLKTENTTGNLGNDTSGNHGYGMTKFFQIRSKYIATPVKSGLMLIHVTRAHERIFFEELTNRVTCDDLPVQKLLYPEEMQLSTEDFSALFQCLPALAELGFEIITDQSDTYKITGVPSNMINVTAKQLFEALLVQIKDDPEMLKSEAKDHIAEVLAKKASLTFAKSLAQEEMQYIVDGLFSCRMPNFTNDGRTIVEIVKTEDIEKMFG